MKYLSLTLLFFSLSLFARDPGTGSNTTVGPGPATPDAGPSDTSIMGGGTPGNQGINNLGSREINQKQLRKMKQKQEEKGPENNTDQKPELDSIE